MSRKLLLSTKFFFSTRTSVAAARRPTAHTQDMRKFGTQTGVSGTTSTTERTLYTGHARGEGYTPKKRSHAHVIDAMHPADNLPSLTL